ncbi:MAG: BrnT family toxin [Anaerolineae bacterium]
MNIRFTWDRQKADRNRQEHEGVTFEEAATVFRDPQAFIFDDDEHSDEEHRELIIGYSRRNRLLIISFTERADVIRIISARKADSDERKDYEQVGR